jgi:hypothetical protein
VGIVVVFGARRSAGILLAIVRGGAIRKRLLLACEEEERDRPGRNCAGVKLAK